MAKKSVTQRANKTDSNGCLGFISLMAMGTVFLCLCSFLYIFINSLSSTDRLDHPIKTSTQATTNLTTQQHPSPTPEIVANIVTPEVLATPIGGGIGRMVVCATGRQSSIYLFDLISYQFPVNMDKMNTIKDESGSCWGASDGSVIVYGDRYDFVVMKLFPQQTLAKFHGYYEQTCLDCSTYQNWEFSLPQWRDDGEVFALQTYEGETYTAGSLNSVRVTDIYSASYATKYAPPSQLTDSGRVGSFLLTKDGNQIIYSEHVEKNGDLLDLWIMNSDGTNKKMIAPAILEPWKDWELSPTEDQVVFISSSTGQPDIYSININSDAPAIQLTNSGVSSFAWGPDNDHIIFISEDLHTLYIMRPDGTEVIQLTSSPDSFINNDYHTFSDFQFSPDSTRIIYSTYKEGYREKEIHILTIGGQANVLLADTSDFSNFLPRWSPDGTKIAFISDRDGNKEIYMMNVDGSQLTRLTETEGDENQFFWLP